MLKTDTDEEPTVEIQGAWRLERCGLRSVGGTGVLAHTLGNVTIRSCAVGSAPQHAPSAYGLTCTDSSTCLVTTSTFQRCRVLGARFLRCSSGALVDCILEQCAQVGALVHRSSAAGDGSDDETSRPPFTDSN